MLSTYDVWYWFFVIKDYKNALYAKWKGSFGSDVGKDHIPEETDEVGKEYLILNGHKVKVDIGGNWPYFPVGEKSLFKFLFTDLDPFFETLDISIDDHLIDWVEDGKQDWGEHQLIEQHWPKNSSWFT